MTLEELGYKEEEVQKYRNGPIAVYKKVSEAGTLYKLELFPNKVEKKLLFYNQISSNLKIEEGVPASSLTKEECFAIVDFYEKLNF